MWGKVLCLMTWYLTNVAHTTAVPLVGVDIANTARRRWVCSQYFIVFYSMFIPYYILFILLHLYSFCVVNKCIHVSLVAAAVWSRDLEPSASVVFTYCDVLFWIRWMEYRDWDQLVQFFELYSLLKNWYADKKVIALPLFLTNRRDKLLMGY